MRWNIADVSLKVRVDESTLMRLFNTPAHRHKRQAYTAPVAKHPLEFLRNLHLARTPASGPVC
jgi:hypothetical protein